MVIKRSPGEEFAGGGRSTSKSTCAFPAWVHWAIDQHPVCPNRARRELWPLKWFLLGRNPWRWACRSIYSQVDQHVDRRKWRSLLVWSHQLTSDLKRCLLFWKCLRWSSRKVVSVPSSVIGGLRGSTATSPLVMSLFMRVVYNKARQVFFCVSQYATALIFASQPKKKTKCSFRFSSWESQHKVACPH